jgi:hypothetical protein
MGAGALFSKVGCRGRGFRAMAAVWGVDVLYAHSCRQRRCALRTQSDSHVRVPNYLAAPSLNIQQSINTFGALQTITSSCTDSSATRRRYNC